MRTLLKGLLSVGCLALVVGSADGAAAAKKGKGKADKAKATAAEASTPAPAKAKIGVLITRAKGAPDPLPIFIQQLGPQLRKQVDVIPPPALRKAAGKAGLKADALRDGPAAAAVAKDMGAVLLLHLDAQKDKGKPPALSVSVLNAADGAFVSEHVYTLQKGKLPKDDATAVVDAVIASAAKVQQPAAAPTPAAEPPAPPPPPAVAEATPPPEPPPAPTPEPTPAPEPTNVAAAVTLPPEPAPAETPAPPPSQPTPQPVVATTAPEPEVDEGPAALEWYAGLQGRGTAAVGGAAVMPGLQAGLRYGPVTRGLAGFYSLIPATMPRGSGTTGFSSQRELTFGYGGLDVGWLFQPRRLAHLRVSVLMGAGAASSKSVSAGGPTVGPNGIWVVEPGLELVINLTDFVHVVAGGRYRWAFGNNVAALPNNANQQLDALTSASADLGVVFGSF